ncbi:hypothetical protein Trydic_g4626 [Trypoxylus dichotomus]
MLANDTMLNIWGNNLNEVVDKINRDLVANYVWSCDNSEAVKINKCKYVILGTDGTIQKLQTVSDKEEDQDEEDEEENENDDIRHKEEKNGAKGKEDKKYLKKKQEITYDTGFTSPYSNSFRDVGDAIRKYEKPMIILLEDGLKM